LNEVALNALNSVNCLYLACCCLARDSVSELLKFYFIFYHLTYTPTQNPLYLLIYSRLRNISYTL